MNPYIIGPYQESDAGKFKGRSHEIDGMFRSFIQNDYLVCYADSGEGKSSILNAGLFPKLRKNRYFPISIRFNFYESDVQNMDFDRVVNTAIDVALGDYSAELIPSSLIFETEEDNVIKWQEELIRKFVWLRLRYSELKIVDENGESIRVTPVLIFDQFEEVFTNPRSQIWTSKFFKWLEELSTDVCPEHILSEVESIEDDVPLMASVKRFKAIFSLRSEYVGDVDYWGLQHYYIPDLKNNRYFLKPLTPKGAEEIVNQDGGLTSLSRTELTSLIVGCAVNSDYVVENLPCIPASILSVICHEIFGYSERDRRQTLQALIADRNKAVEDVLEKYYIETLTKCGISDDRSRDTFENALVDDKGNRKRIGVRNKELSALSQEQVSRLVEENMLRVVSRSEIGDGDVVELPHDRFCLIIKNHKNKRFKEIEERNRSLKEWMHFGVLCAVLGILALLMHFDFIEMLRPIINNVLAQKWTVIGDSFKDFIQHKPVASEYYSGWMAIVSILMMALIMPLEFLGMAKQWKVFTMVVSIVGICVSGWFVRLDEIWDFYAGTSIFMSLLISLGILAYTSFKWSKIVKSDVSVWPLWGSWFLFFSFLYWEFVCCLIIGVNEPGDSWEFIILLPILLLLWTWCFFKAKIKSEGLMHGKWWLVAQVFLLLGCLSLLAFNAGTAYWKEYKFSFQMTIMLLAMILVLVAVLLKNVSSVHKRMISIGLNAVAILTIYVFNLGYNPLEIEYRSVYKVASWRTVYIKDDVTGLYGICNAVSGDTIIPCVVDTCKYGSEIVIKSDMFESNPINGGGWCNSDRSFMWNWGDVEATFICSPTLEEHMIKAERSLGDSLALGASRLYNELRSLNIDYVVGAKPYLLTDVTSIGMLDSLQSLMLDKTLDDLLNSDDTTVTRYGTKYRPKLEVLTDADLYEFYSVTTRNLFLHILKDRISCADYPSVIQLLRTYPLLYFNNVPLMEMNVNYNSKAAFNNKPLITDFRTSICSDDILAQKCFVWYKLFIHLCLTDNSANAQAFQERSQSHLNNLSNLLQLSPILNDLVNDWDNIKNASTLEQLDWYMKKVTFKQKVLDAFRPFADTDFSVAGAYAEVLELDQEFDRFSIKLIEAMLQALEKNPYGMYNSAFEDICKSLILVRLTRGYDISSELEKIKKINKGKNEYYDTLTSLGEVIGISNSKEVKDNMAAINEIKELIGLSPQK